jgi:pimeloyl-ACP methyl ester carboxylesterase
VWAEALLQFGLAEQEDCWQLPEQTAFAFVVGEHDAKYVQIGQELATRNPTMQLEVVRNAWHAPHLDQPEAFASRAFST